MGIQTLRDHPSYKALRSASESAPNQSAALIHTFSDLIAAQEWEDVEVIENSNLDQSKVVLLRGRPKSSDKEKFVYPMSLENRTNFKILSEIFNCINPKEGPKKVLLAIVSTDSSVVYYELSDGIVSPKEAPE